jgi:hypothetical protein
MYILMNLFGEIKYNLMGREKMLFGSVLMQK